jgi:dihydroxyacetone kinase phosphoprotein-dependent L subunit
VSALIFDCDGVLADTERHGHLPAFNATFQSFGLPVRWSAADYAEKLRIGGGKERMASLFADPGFTEQVPGDRAELLATWHATKTAIFQQLVADGRIPPRPGIARIIGEALDQGWPVAVASTSAEASVRAVLAHAVGEKNAARIPVFAGDIVPAKKPDPAIYRLTVSRLGLDPADTLVIEDSRNGLLAAAGAGLSCLVTVNEYTRDEDFAEAVLVVSELGDPGRPAVEVLANRGAARPGAYLELDDLRACPPGGAGRGRRRPMSGTAVKQTELVVRTIAVTAIENEKYFGDLDSVVGDGDFGYSLARGFEKLLEGWDGLDRTDAGTFLKRSGMVIASRIGGTSGPLWGTAFLRAGSAAGSSDDPDVVAMLRAAIEGIKARGQSDVGDKTLLDALVPFTDRLERELAAGASSTDALRAATAASRRAADATSEMVAKRGRAAYTGERSRGSVDAGATAVAVIAERISETWQK